MTALFALVSALLLSGTSSYAQGVNDAQIAAIVVEANQVAIDAGKLGNAISTSADVKTFAKLMIHDHTSVYRSATLLVTKLKITPEENPTSQNLRAESKKNLAQLEGIKAVAFDKAYIDHEVTYHQHVIDAIDKTLIPNAHNDELKALLVEVRAVFVAHLQHAKDLQSTLNKKTPR